MINQDLKILIYNMKGQLVYQSTINDKIFTLTKNDLSNGTYFYSITSESSSLAKGKFIYTE
jgi:hypothetical protein